MPNGKYQVYGGWLGSSTNASECALHALQRQHAGDHGSREPAGQFVGSCCGGANWKLLGTVTVTGGRLNVRLNNQADGAVVADAIRIVQLAPTATLNRLEKPPPPTWACWRG